MGIFEFIVVIVAICIGGSVMSDFFKHRSKIAQLHIESQNKRTDTTGLASIEALRDEIRALRDTTTQYDMSFDSALQRMEQRVEHLERRTIANEANSQDMRIGR